MNSQVFKLILLNHDGNVINKLSYDSIYDDDSIECMKQKLCQQLEDKNPFHYSFFYKTKTQISLESLFHQISKGNKSIDHQTFQICCINMNCTYTRGEKEYYDIDDFSLLSSDVITHSLDHNGSFFEVLSNPLHYNPIYDHTVKSFLNTSLIFELEKVDEGEIYAIHIDEFKESNVYHENALLTYFPHAGKESKYDDAYNSHIFLHHEFYRKYDVANKIRGEPNIQTIHFQYKSQNSFLFPREILFKKLHSDKDTPLIVFQEDHKSEPIYRIFSPFVDLNGKKKPYLHKKTLQKISKKVKHTESFVIYFYERNQDADEYRHIYACIDEHGNIHTYIENANMLVEDIQALCIKMFNNTIDKVIKYIDPSQKFYQNIESIQSPNIEILEIQYGFTHKDIEFQNMKKANLFFQNIFHFTTTPGKQFLYYKRAPNYDKMNDIDATIVKMKNKNKHYDEIRKEILPYFKDDETKANAYLEKIYDSLKIQDHMEESGEKVRKIRIINNPGVYIEFNKNSVILDNISNLSHISFIIMFFKNLIFLSLDHLSNQEKFSHFNIQEDEEIMVDNNEPTEKSTFDSFFENESEEDEDDDDEQMQSVAAYSEDEESEEESEDELESVGAETEDEEDEEQDEESEEEVESVAAETENEEEEDDEEVQNVTVNNENENEIQSVGENSNNENEIQSVGENSDNEDFESDNEMQMGGAKLNLHPNPLASKIEKKQPLLYTKNQSNQYSNYSRICPWGVRRTPVLLTQEEKDKIDQEHPGSYDEIVKYSTDPNETFYYICPRYWSLKDNRPITQQEVDENPELKNAMIPDKAKSTDLSKQYIYDLTKEGKLPKRYPGFLDASKHEKGLFMPCCFDYNEKKNKSKKILSKYERNKELAEEQMKLIHESKLTSSTDIMELLAKHQSEEKSSNDTYSLRKQDFYEYSGETRMQKMKSYHLGDLPIHLKKFLNIKIKDKSLVRQAPYRAQDNKGFLSALALVFLNKEKPTAEDMIDHIISKLTIDNILQFHNGNIPTLFYRDNDVDLMTNDDIEQYKNSKLLKMGILKKEDKKFKIIVNGFERFIEYLKDPQVYVDYYYLWDIICSGILNTHDPGQEINMIIIENKSLDITNNLSVICPSPGFSKYRFKEENPFVLFYHEGSSFQPVFQKSSFRQKQYFEVVTQKPQRLLDIMSDIYSKCTIKIDSKYSFKENIDIYELLENVPSFRASFEIKHQVVHPNNKTIGLYIKDMENDAQFFVPLKPSSIHHKLPYRYLRDNIWTDYSTTKAQLRKVYKVTNKQLKCVPQMKVIEDDVIVGFLTKSNQFIQINPPLLNDFKDSIPEYSSNKLSSVDKALFETQTEIDEEREIFIRNVRLEKQFYTSYVNSLHYHIHKHENIELKKEIKKHIQSRYEDIDATFDSMYNILKEMTLNHFQFTSFPENVLREISEVTMCGNDETHFCTKGETKQLMIPVENLHTGEDNLEKYVSTLTHDLIVNHEVQRNFMDYKSYYFNDEVHYRLNKDEMILIDSNLKPYVESLTKRDRSGYIHQDVYDDIEPDEMMNILRDIEPSNEKEEPETEEEEEEEDEPTPETEEQVNEEPSPAPEERSEEPDGPINEEPSPESDPTPQQQEPVASPQPEPVASPQQEEKQSSPKIPPAAQPEPIKIKPKSPNQIAQSPALQLTQTIPPAIKHILNDNKVVFRENISDKKQVLRSKLETKYLRKHDCIQSERLTLKWRKVFPKMTTEFSFKLDSPKCNYLIVMYLLKLHNRELFSELNIYSIKLLLIKFYKKYIHNEGLRSKIASIWKQQYKLKEAELLKKGTSIETIIHDDTYTIGEVDLCLLMYHFELPIAVYINSRKTFTPITFSLTNKTNNYSFVRVSYHKEKCKLFLNVRKTTTFFSLDELKDNTVKESIEENQFQDFRDYMASK